MTGIVRFMRTHAQWHVFLEQSDLTRDPPAWLANWSGDGIISRATTDALVTAVRASAIPLVELTDRREDLGFPHVRSNDAAISRLAAEHLIERGFTRFGFCGFDDEAWSARRQREFVDHIARTDATCEVYNSPWHGATARSWDEEQRHLAAWLASLPRPVGIMASNDVRGQHLLEACARQNLIVPEDVAIVGVDNDEILCQLCHPPLSSVVPNTEAIGYRAADLLARLMDGEPLAEREHQIEPLGVATRRSTDVVAIDDRDVAAALNFIRENACRGLTVDEVLARVPISRSTLERQLRKYVGRSPQQEIRHVQVQRVKELLATTDFALDRIARLAGFEHPEYLHVVFKRAVGLTPGDYRRTAQPG